MRARRVLRSPSSTFISVSGSQPTSASSLGRAGTCQRAIASRIVRRAAGRGLRTCPRGQGADEGGAWVQLKRRVTCRNREAPCAAQPAGASAPHRAFQGGNHPPSIDHPVLPFVSTNVIARQSLRSGGRFALPARPAPVARFVRADTAEFAPTRLPGPSSPTRRRSSPRLPGAPPLGVHRLGRSPVARFRLRRQRMIPHRPRFRLVNPVGPSTRGHSPKGSTTRSRPFLGLRLACACRCVAHSARPAFARSRGIFESHRVIHRTSPPSPEVSGSSTVRPQPVHRFVHSAGAGLAAAWLTIRRLAGHNRSP